MNFTSRTSAEESDYYGDYHNDTENDENLTPSTTQAATTTAVTPRPSSLINNFVVNLLRTLSTYKTIQMTTPASEITAENYNDLDESSTFVNLETTTDFTQVYNQTINCHLVLYFIFLGCGDNYYSLEHRNNARGRAVLRVDLSIRGNHHRRLCCHHRDDYIFAYKASRFFGIININYSWL